MGEEILPLDKVEGIAKQFARERWGAHEDQTVVESVILTYVGKIHQYLVRGSISQPQFASSQNPYPGFFFEVQVSAKDGKVIGFSTRPFPEPQIVCPIDLEPEKRLFGIDPDTYRLDRDWFRFR